MEPDRDHFYRYGDVYHALETCEVLEMNLTTLRRQQLVSEATWTQVRTNAAAIRARLEALLAA
jgi:hypothetical protein